MLAFAKNYLKHWLSPHPIGSLISWKSPCFGFQKLNKKSPKRNKRRGELLRYLTVMLCFFPWRNTSTCLIFLCRTYTVCRFTVLCVETPGTSIILIIFEKSNGTATANSFFYKDELKNLPYSAISFIICHMVSNITPILQISKILLVRNRVDLEYRVRWKSKSPCVIRHATIYALIQIFGRID